MVRRIAVVLLILFANLQSLHASDLQIIIVKSSDNTYYNQTIETLINSVDANVRIKIIDSNVQKSVSGILQKANIVVTLGGNFGKIISSQLPDQLVINAYITLEQATQFQRRNQKNIAVLLNQPFERYLAFSRQLLNLKTLGIINRSKLAPNSRQLKILKKLNLKLDQYQLGGTNKKLLATLRQLIRKNDALLMLPNQSIYNRDTLKGILLTAYRGRTPVISYSPGHVKSGALAAIYSSPVDIGQQLANLINQYNKGRLNTTNKMIYAESYSIATNRSVAHALGLNLPGEDKLRQFIDEVTR